jgi:hypothetical protein
MSTIRSIDWTIQVVAGAILLFSLVLGRDLLLFAMIGEFFFGIYQLISAIINTTGMYRSMFRRKIIIYYTVADRQR